MNSNRFPFTFACGVVSFAAVLALLGAAGAQAQIPQTGAPPPRDCIGRGLLNANGTLKTAAQCQAEATAAGQPVGPLWQQAEYDCITGDHYIKQGNSGSNSCTGLPSNACYQPDVYTPEDSNVQVRCDDWTTDSWERPYSPGSDFQAHDDLVYALISQDEEWLYFLIQLYGLTGGKLDAAYAIEIDTDPEVLPPPNCGTQLQHDDRPCPGGAAPYSAGVSCTDWFLRTTSPTGNISNTNTWSRLGVTAFHDLDQDLGGDHCHLNDQFARVLNGQSAGSPWSGNGMETLVADQGGGANGGEWADGLYAMRPSNCGTMAPAGWEQEVIGLDPGDTINFNQTCVILAARKDMFAAYLTKPRKLRSQAPFLAADHEYKWRAWAAKGVQDNQNVDMHDKYNRQESGDAYVDQQYYPPSNVKELDSTARIGDLHFFGPPQSCPPDEQAEAELQAFGEFQTFTAAVAPIGQTESRDSLFLSSLLPLENRSRWPGQLRHFIQPIPLIQDDVDGDGEDDFVPDPTETCSDGDDVGCLAWDAAVAILAQSPTSAQVTNDRQIGTATGERRVFYTQGTSFSPNGAAGIPRAQRELDYVNGTPPGFPSNAVAIDLANGFGLNPDPNNSTQVNQAKDKIAQIIRQTLVEQTAPDPADTTQTITFTLGDAFHAEPFHLGGPTNFAYLANDLGGNGSACNDSVNPNQGYRCFFERHRFRRKVVLKPSNDGQLHAFDAGFFRASVSGGRLNGEFDRGTGRELFSYIPRPMLQHTAEMTTLDHDFGVDATPIVEDFFFDPAHNGTPTANDRQWRSVAIGGFGRGGRGYYALDLTQPDHLDVETVVNVAGLSDIAFVPDDGGSYVPSCNANYSAAQCGALSYPAVLWEFEDTCGGNPCDEDANGIRDLAFTWSRPNSGRVRVQVGSATEIRHVAIFGGGYDPELPLTSGNFLYMVDVETGRVLLKRAVVGGVPAEPAAVDLDGDTFLDTVYFATAAGFLYKLDVSLPAVYDSLTSRVLSTEWIPFQIFSTGGRPVFLAPTVVFVGNAGQYAVTFGTGDLDDIFTEQASPGRYYMLLDQDFTSTTSGLPFTEANYQTIALDDTATLTNLLLNPGGSNLPGWVLELDATEKVVSDTTAISGLLSFTTYVTETQPDTSGPTDPQTGEACFEEEVGTGRIYRLLATNANPLVGTERFIEVAGFASAPFVVPSGFSQQSAVGNDPNPFASQEMQDIRQDLMGLFPSNCRFGNFSMRLSVNVSTGEQIPLAEIPQCVVVKNWKEF